MQPGRARPDLTIDRDCGVWADDRAHRAASASAQRVDKLGRLVAFVESAGYTDDVLWADGGAELAPLAALGVDNDTSLYHFNLWHLEGCLFLIAMRVSFAPHRANNRSWAG